MISVKVKNRWLAHLQELPADQQKRFLRFAQSPYHNRSLPLTRLTAFVLQSPDAPRTRSALERAAWPDTASTPSPQALRDLLSAGMKLLEAFWCVEALAAQPLDRELDVLEAMLEQQMDRAFQGRLRRVRRKLAEDPMRDARHYRRMARLESLADAHFTRAAERRTDEALRRRIEALDQAYRAEKLREACEVLNRARILQQAPEVPGMAALEADVDQALSMPAEQQSPVVAVWGAVWRLLRSPEGEDRFFILRQALDRHADAMAPDDLRAIWAYAQNHCIRQANTGAEGWLEPLLDLYREGLERGIILDGKELPQSTYKNIVTAGLRAQAFDWTLGFIEQYADHLAPGVRDNAYTYNRANYHYALGELDRAQELLRDVEFSDLFYGLGAKTMLLKIYFDQGAWEPLEALVAAFRAYLRRNRLLGEAQRQAYRNLVALTESLARIQRRADYVPRDRTRRDFAAWRQRLEDGRPVMNAGWLRQRAENWIDAP
jgi:hypothetical protein